jgi:hypothetical protein|tara:strand:- start:301 stop:483 length:183 start_codon:yes stop_codon:yes gene_type:complete
MKIPNELQELDNLIMNEILHDVISGNLLMEADDKTLDMMLTQMWEMKEMFQSMGVIIGEA